MNLKKILITVASPAVLLAASAAPTLAATSSEVGTWAVFDRGPGAWAGGTLRSDGSATGAGQFAYKASDGSQEVAHIDASNWVFADTAHTQIALCANITGVQGPDFPIGVAVFACIPLNVTGTGAPQPSPFDPDTFEKVMFQH